jgi:hypothetical protein
MREQTTAAPPVRQKRGPKPHICGERFNFFPGEELTKAMLAVEQRRKKMKLPMAFTRSYIFREGGRRMVKFLNELMDKAGQGDLHAKKRVATYGVKRKQHLTGTKTNNTKNA